MTYLSKNMLVTGGAGFIGSHFIREALTYFPELTITNLDKLTYAGSLSRLANLPDNKRHNFTQGDINDRSLVMNLLEKNSIDSIVHFAAESHVDNSITHPDEFIQTNVMGTFTLLACAKEFWQTIKNWDENQCRFYHISTDEVYGSLALDDVAFDENTAFNPRSPYSASKASSDHLVNAYYHTYGLPTLISHCSNNYGPYQHHEKFIPTIIRSCLEQKSIPIYGNGKNIRDWLYVTDHCQGILNILTNGKTGVTYNLGGSNEWDNISLAKNICAIMDELKPDHAPHQRLLAFVKDRQGHDFRYAVNFDKVTNELSWQPHTSFAMGLKKTIEFYMNVQHEQAEFTVGK